MSPSEADASLKRYWGSISILNGSKSFTFMIILNLGKSVSHMLPALEKKVDEDTTWFFCYPTFPVGITSWYYCETLYWQCQKEVFQKCFWKWQQQWQIPVFETRRKCWKEINGFVSSVTLHCLKFKLSLYILMFYISNGWILIFDSLNTKYQTFTVHRT